MTTILLVEDNEINRDMLRRRLERKGYQVIIAVNGAEGVTKAQSDQPDLVLMDLHLPILDGWEATRQIKANPKTQQIPVIALTADAIAGEREKAIAAGCDEYDTKPVDFARLLEKMDLLLKPVAPKPPEPVNHTQPSVSWSSLRQELELPIYNMISYSDMLLDAIEDSSLSNDLQKIYVSALQLLKLVQGILNPVLLEVQQQDWTIDLFAPALRRELLTPLSTIIGYCELLLEEAPDDFVSDLEQLHASAQQLLSLVNNLDRVLARHTQKHESSGSFTWQPTQKTDFSVSGNNPILIVAANTAIARQLERQGYFVKIATTQQQALEILSDATFDLILLEVNHIELLSDQKLKDVPILLIAASDQMPQVLQGIALGATDYLIQPCPSTLLRTKVATCLQLVQLREQVEQYQGVVEELREQKQLEADLKQQVETLQFELEQVKRSSSLQAAEVVQPDDLQPELPEVQSPNSPLKILLVEDNELNSDMLSRRLLRHGYEVVLAGDGAEGVSKALSEQPQVILMDISLPVMDGWEATQQLKANPQTSHIPIIALTAHAMAGDREKAIAAGCNDYDTKPIELPRLLSKIEDCLKSSISVK
ncbi:response regulator [Leptolyngbya sp. NIES-2104]|uniref:response regulator n=1 Tax=Leptolyngbya sp. NIES-2104 TaxID=1552121 RepID=UPI0006EC92D6|nr:response regulator [Leptolyngbya sp. NIES-2104]GAP94308.1 circadian input kinase A [Leptolyngbya sp. NIES-2104]